jgi:hypothetical protein
VGAQNIKVEKMKTFDLFDNSRQSWMLDKGHYFFKFEVKATKESPEHTISQFYNRRQLKTVNRQFHRQGVRSKRAIKEFKYLIEKYSIETIAIGDVFNAIDSLSHTAMMQIHDRCRPLRQRPRIILKNVIVERGEETFVFGKASESEKLTVFKQIKNRSSLDSTTFRSVISSPIPYFYDDMPFRNQFLNRIRDRLFENIPLRNFSAGGGGLVEYIVKKPKGFKMGSPFHPAIGVYYDFNTFRYHMVGLGFRYVFPYRVQTNNRFKTFRDDYSGNVENIYAINGFQATVRYNFVDFNSYVQSPLHSFKSTINPYVKILLNFYSRDILEVESSLSEESNAAMAKASRSDSGLNIGGGVGTKIFLAKRVYLEVDLSIVQTKFYGEDYVFSVFGDAEVSPTEFKFYQAILQCGFYVRLF